MDNHIFIHAGKKKNETLYSLVQMDAGVSAKMLLMDVDEKREKDTETEKSYEWCALTPSKSSVLNNRATKWMKQYCIIYVFVFYFSITT